MTVKLLKFSAPRGIRVVKAEGQYVWDDTGKKYLDFYMGYGAAFLGHRNPKIVKALTEQMGRYLTITPAFDTDVMDECLDRLGKILPPHLERVFFLNSGSEACDLALKIARKLTGRKKILAFVNSFHGRTMGSLSATWNPKYREGFDPYPFETIFTPYNNAEAVEEKLGEDFAAVILEPVQGEGGIIPATDDFLKTVEEKCRDVGAFLIVDEIQSGFGRTGFVWAHQKAGIKPDMLTAAKAIAGGFPASLVAVTEEIASRLKETDHGSTYGGNPLALAAITAAVELLIEEDVPSQAHEKGAALGEMLARFVDENRGLFRGFRRAGLMIGVEMRSQPGTFIKLLQRNGLIGFKAGLTVLRFLPPYLITEQDMKTAVDAMVKTTEEYKTLPEKSEPLQNTL
ncbi:MAG: aspartate aminotransferase family protein [Candidatus Caldarchaeum sp.]|uniref:Putative [LysW]-aminoadipate semialdehyde/glutamate semialdehyde transaminase n=1 Tax=Caldiarchaeum subterraneum TaxID=311458 RepID=A0A7C5QFH3_CALS0